MTGIWIYTLASVIVVSLMSFVGVIAISSNRGRVQQTVFIMVSLAVGAMFGDVFIHLLPQAFASTSMTLATSI